jgi:hypothetical protein|tara:strand:+ start:869 stop:1024 length:156 start_codon:yes stop_codon:yes gene_type:complete
MYFCREEWRREWIRLETLWYGANIVTAGNRYLFRAVTIVSSWELMKDWMAK